MKFLPFKLSGLIFSLLFFLFACASSPDPIPDEIENVGVEVDPEPTNTPFPIPTAEPAAVLDLDDLDPCSVAGQEAWIEQAFESYDPQGDALLDLNRWVNVISAEITSNCLPDEFQLSDPAELESLLDKLYEGGYIIYVRHTHTDRSREDTDVSLGRCDTQRILSERGRDEALMIRNAYDRLELPIDQIISTQFCRTLETAVLAFDVPLLVSRTELSDRLGEFLATQPEPGSNTIIVAHIGTLRNLRGLDDTFDEGDSLIYRPNGDGTYEFIGRIGLYDWPIMASFK